MKTPNPKSNSRRQFFRRSSSMLTLMLPGMHAGIARADDLDLYPVVQPGTSLSFPSDHGAHPAYRTEWWYLTASLQSPNGPIGLQVTFFRSRTPYGRNNPSRFAPRQLVLAHAALAIPDQGRLLHDQQSFRQQDEVARYSTIDTNIAIGLPDKRWTMQRTASDQYLIDVNAEHFKFSFSAESPSTMAKPVLQGKNGFSQKGPETVQASYYYSRPQLRVEGEYHIRNERVPVSGTGWLDHEWSSEILAENAAGWDWVGLNFSDGSALMAFQMRTDKGDTLYSTARIISVNQDRTQSRDEAVKFSPLRYWQSPRTEANYPVSIRIQTGDLDIIIEPLFDDQELDATGSTGVIYWEGSVQVWPSQNVASDGKKSGEPIASGYLELTGYAQKLSL